MLKRLLLLSLAGGLLAGGLAQTGAQASNPRMPDWAADSVIYEVNVRQFSEAGTFAAVKSQLPRLRDLGVEVLWLMPIQPISLKNRKGSLGSPYSVADYTAVNPDYGTAADFAALVDAAHALGLKVIIDWVANHSGWDNPWITQHKDWYTQDSQGNIVWPPGTDWTDVADLNYGNSQMRRAMIDAMKYWVTTFNIDGFRCDVAGGVPTDFWNAAVSELSAIKPLLMLAENSDNMSLLQSAFTLNYGWDLQSLMYGVVNRGDSPQYFNDYVTTQSSMPAGTASMHFITNHDENSWNGTEFERYGAAVDAMAVLTYTLPGVPLIYNGQEIGLRRRLAFFEKDAIDWTAGVPRAIYPQLNKLKTDNSALDVGANPGKFLAFDTSTSALLAFARFNGSDRVVVVLNGTGTSTSGVVTAGGLAGTYRNAITNTLVKIRPQTYFPLGGWGYRVLTSDLAGAKTVLPTRLTVGRTKISLQRGQSTRVAPVFSPREVTDTYLRWTSSAPKIAKVSGSGTVTAVGRGVARVEARAANGVKVAISVTVR